MNKTQKTKECDLYAIIETGGKQYQVVPGKTLSIEKVEGAAGDQIEFDKVLFRKTSENKFEFGKPFIKNITVKANIVKQSKKAKVIIFKFKRRKKYRTKHGHRQPQTVIRIESIQ